MTNLDWTFFFEKRSKHRGNWSCSKRTNFRVFVFGASPHQHTSQPFSRAPNARAKKIRFFQFVNTTVKEPQLFPNLAKMCDFTPNLFQDEVRNFGQTTRNVSFCVPFLSRAHEALARKFRYFITNVVSRDSKMLQNTTETGIVPNARAHERLFLARFPLKILVRLLRERRRRERRKLGFLIFFNKKSSKNRSISPESDK